jgi:chromosome segregation ATPase
VKNNKEVAQVADADRTYTEAEHLALMADAVKRETASVTEVKESAETKVSELSARVDVLEAEKASLETAKAETQKAFDDYKAEVERAREVEAAKKDRLEKVKAANAGLPDSYFTDERIQRWAEMAEAAFAAFIEDITPLAGTPAKETAAFSGGETPTSTETAKATVGSIFAARRGVKN